MMLPERMERVRQSAASSLATGPLAPVHQYLSCREKLDDAARMRLLTAFSATGKPTPEWFALRGRLEGAGFAADQHFLERTLIAGAVLQAIDAVPSAPVHSSVQHLFCKEFEFYANPPADSIVRFDMNRRPFVFMVNTALFERFPAGEQQWEVSGFPRSWLLKIPARLLLPTLAFLARKTRGFAPFFVTHLASTTRTSPVLLEREFYKAFYRIARSLELQPGIKAIMGSSWLRSPETHRISPHLAFVNAPFLEAGGMLTDLGPETPDAGFLSGNKERAELYKSGKYKPTTGVVICTREQALRWAREHSEWEDKVAVR